MTGSIRHFSFSGSLPLTALLLIVGQSTGQSLPNYETRDAIIQHTLGINTCQKCHAEQVSVLKQHPHYTHGRALQRNDRAVAMAKAIGGSTVKRTNRCARCHYTLQAKAGKAKAIDAITCESCHGGAKDWLLVHNDYGGANITKESEPPAHRQQRIFRSIELGMHHPAHLYSLARSCYRCHIVDDEQVVNQAAHPARSANFNMVAWSQGTMRHNFLRTDGRGNAASDPARQSMMYVVGLLADIEYSLKATSKATAASAYASGHAQHCRAMQQLLADVVRRLNDPRLVAALSKMEELKFSLANTESFATAAEEISRLAWEFSLDPPENLEPIFPLLPPPSTYR